jgi:hypoxanthine phosphoribosyltransferase
MTFDLIRQVKESGLKFDVVVGIKNGGLHVSELIAEALKLPHQTVHISHYEGKRVLKNIDYNSDVLNTLVVDDLVDTSETMKLFHHHFCLSACSAVLFWKKDCGYKPTFYAMEKPKGWIVFPWELT